MDRHDLGNSANRGIFAMLGFVIQAAGAVIVGSHILMCMLRVTLDSYHAMFGL
jgi:hypothetical protein